MSSAERAIQDLPRDEPVVVSTPIDEYQHPETLSRISLVGMIHVGQPDYYEQVQTEVQQRQDDRDGLVHYEMVRKPTQAELDTASEPLKRRMEDHRAMLKGTFTLLKLPGLVDQREALKYLPDWENHDADALDIARRIGAFTLRRQILAAKLLPIIFSLFDEKERLAMFSQMLDKSLSEPERERHLVAKILFGDTDPVILDYRNDIATRAVDDQLALDPESDIVMIWGAGHLPGLGANMRRRGYGLSDQTRLVAIDPASMPIGTSD